MLILDQETQELFLDKIKQLLTNGETHQTVKITRGKREKHDGFGELLETNTIYQENKETSIKPTPKWVYDLLIKSVSIENAITLLQREGYLIVDPNLTPQSEEIDKSRGLSDFAIMELRSKLLGIELEPVDES